MVEWKKRFATGLLVIPVVFLLVQYKIGALLIIHLFTFIAYGEFQQIVTSIHRQSSPDSDIWYIDNMNTSFMAKIPVHIFIQSIYFMSSDSAIHLSLFFTVGLMSLIRIYNFITISKYVNETKNEVNKKAPFLDRKMYVLTFSQLACDFVGLLMFVYPFAFPIYFYNYKNGYSFIILWLITSFQADNGALFIGSWLGKHQFVPKISPKKTWEGVSGALFLSVLTNFIISLYSDDGYVFIPNIPTKHYLIISLIGAMSSIIGDFIESFFKRAADLKDSGVLFPGHGGMLDRLDSLTFSAPIIFLYCQLFLDQYLVKI